MAPLPCFPAVYLKCLITERTENMTVPEAAIPTSELYMVNEVKGWTVTQLRVFSDIINIRWGIWSIVCKQKRNTTTGIIIQIGLKKTL